MLNLVKLVVRESKHNFSGNTRFLRPQHIWDWVEPELVLVSTSLYDSAVKSIEIV